MGFRCVRIDPRQQCPGIRVVTADSDAVVEDAEPIPLPIGEVLVDEDGQFSRAAASMTRSGSQATVAARISEG